MESKLILEQIIIKWKIWYERLDNNVIFEQIIDIIQDLIKKMETISWNECNDTAAKIHATQDFQSRFWRASLSFSFMQDTLLIDTYTYMYIIYQISLL